MARERTYLERERTLCMNAERYLSTTINLPKRSAMRGSDKLLVRMPTICIGPSLDDINRGRRDALGGVGRNRSGRATRSTKEEDFPAIDMFSSRMQVRLKLVESRQAQKREAAKPKTPGLAKLPTALHRR